jgi:hypothetical protein
MEEFEAYLINKKIDPVLFKAGEPETWQKFKTLFYQVSPKSFTMQKLFLINKIRKKYHYKQETTPETKTTMQKKKPIIRRKA